VSAVAQGFALLEALIYIAVFPLEAFFLRHAQVQRFLSTPAANVPAVMMWAIPVGFRNLLIGAGVITGLVVLHTGHEEAGAALVVYCCAYMVLGGSTMALADALGHYPRKGASIPGTLAATVPAALALITAALQVG
jgi:putative membrane protein